jgi:hypothetical protein
MIFLLINNLFKILIIQDYSPETSQEGDENASLHRVD